MHASSNVANAVGGVAVTPSDTTLFIKPVRFVYVGITGNIAVLMRDGTTVTLVGVPTGTMLPLDCRRINATGTTATSIVALY